MIVKNKENHIEACLQSVKDYVAEMVIVDRGSTDQTKEICKKYGASIYEYDWDDDFSSARNFGLQFCQSEWILWLDADEILDSSDVKKLPHILEKTAANVISLPVFNYCGKLSEINENDFYLLYQPRMFRNHLNFSFKNKLHETLQFPDGITQNDIKKVDIPIHHYGYTDDHVQQKNKVARNLSILEKELQTPNHSPWVEYHLASEFYRLGRYEEAFLFVNEAIVLFLTKKLHPPSVLYKLKYDILIKSKNFTGAWPSILKAIELYPDYVDLHYYKGIILFHLNEYSEAIAAFKTCLELGDRQSDYLVLNGVGSFKAREYIALCNEKMKSFRE